MATVHATIIKAVNGFEFRGGRKKTVIPRGMITKEMVFELLELIRVNDPILFLPVAIIFFVAMRISEFTLMTTLDLTYCKEHSQWNILVHSNKRLNARTTKKRGADRVCDTYVKYSVCEEGVYYIYTKRLNSTAACNVFRISCGKRVCAVGVTTISVG